MPIWIDQAPLWGKWLLSCGLGLIAGLLSARLIYFVGMKIEQRKWVQERRRLSLIQREKLELTKRRRLRVSPTEKLDTLAAMVQNFQLHSPEGLRELWTYFPPRDRVRRVRRLARWLGIGIGLVVLVGTFILQSGMEW